MNLTPERIALLRKVQEKITTVPEAYDQSRWISPANSAPCGTACCIAGWACLLSGEYIASPMKTFVKSTTSHRMIDVKSRARTLLGMSSNDSEILFGGAPEADWPEEFATKWADNLDDYDEVADNAVAAKIASDYIDWIIENKRVCE